MHFGCKSECPASGRDKKALIVTVATLLCVLGCGTAPIKSYYTLQNESPDDVDEDTPPLCKAALGIEPVEVSPPYDISKIAFRPDPLEVRFYTQSHWVSPPEELFSGLLTRRIEEAHLFTSVDRTVSVSGPHLSLLMKVQAFEEVDKDRAWQGRLAVKLFLRDEMEGRLLWKHRFDTRRPAKKNDVKSVVRILNRIYNDEMEAAISSLRGFLSTGGCRVHQSYIEDDDSYLDDSYADEDRRNSATESAADSGGAGDDAMVEASADE